MSGFIVEALFVTGWRRTGEIYWRYRDAVSTANRKLEHDFARAIRILPCVVSETAVYEAEHSEEALMAG